MNRIYRIMCVSNTMTRSCLSQKNAMSIVRISGDLGSLFNGIVTQETVVDECTTAEILRTLSHTSWRVAVSVNTESGVFALIRYAKFGV